MNGTKTLVLFTGLPVTLF